MKLYFVTKNRLKVKEISDIAKEFNIEIIQIPEQKTESKEMDLFEVAKYNAKKFFEKYKKPIIVDDTGVFFKAYPNFPGNHPKLIFNFLGYKGLLKLLDNEDRTAEFKSVIAYCNREVKLFEGTLECTVDTKVNCTDLDVLPYERVMLYKGLPMAKMSRDEKNKISHRSNAFRKLCHWLTIGPTTSTNKLKSGR